MSITSPISSAPTVTDPIGYIAHQLTAFPLPGEAAQYRLAPASRLEDVRLARQQEAFRQCAVLLMLYQDMPGQEWFLPLIRRAGGRHVHANQIALAGGKQEPEDADLWATAIRENDEELGIPSSKVECIGRLSPVHIPVSAFSIYPFVGKCRMVKPLFHPASDEVGELYRLPLKVLLKLKPTTRTVAANHKTMNVPAFDWDGCIIWGATAMILSEWQAVCQKIPGHQCF